MQMRFPLDQDMVETFPHVLGVILQEGRPGLWAWFGGANEGGIFLKSVFGNGQAEFEQFAADAFGASQPILMSHLPDQRDGL